MKILNILFAVFFICAVFSSVFSQVEQSAVISLEGFDAVSLVQGRQIKGKPEFAVVHKGFKYLFTTKANRKKFEANPELYEVQNNGECTVMRGVKTDASLFTVYQGKIYAFGTPLCKERFALSPQSFLNRKERTETKKQNVAIVLFEGVELLDFAGPGEVFAAAQTIEGENAFNVYTVAASTEPLVSQGFLTVTPQYSFDDAPKPDIVIFPGGNINNLAKDEKAMTWAKRIADESKIAMSVCNGAFVLAQAKLLNNKQITTHWASIGELRKQVPTATVLENVRFVDNGQVITTAGVSAGIDGALHVVERLLGASAAKLTAKYMEYNWQPEK